MHNAYYVWGEGSSGEQLFSSFATEADADAFARNNDGAMLARSAFNADELVLLDWLFANAHSIYGYDTSYDAHTDKNEIKHLQLNTRKLKHFKLCAYSNIY